jgi:hypothetical protein
MHASHSEPGLHVVDISIAPPRGQVMKLVFAHIIYTANFSVTGVLFTVEQ